MKRVTRAALALSLTLSTGLAGAVATGPAAVAAPAAPAYKNAAGITVKSVKQVTARTHEIVMTTKAIDPSTTYAKELRVRVTLPVSYNQQPNKRYPSLYLLHGQGGEYSDWTEKGDLENIVGNRDLIVITPEGGRAGWYTNWRDNNPAQQWETFHINQLIPFIDANLRTKNNKSNRAIGGLSMGGFGTMHYATRHPELFAHAVSFSGGLDLDWFPVRSAVVGSSAQQGLGANGAFGGLWTGLSNFREHNPKRNVEALRGMSLSMYAGDAFEGGVEIERHAGQSTHRFAKALAAKNIPHHWEMYGHPGKVGKYTCNGGHNFGCWSMSLTKDMDRIMKAVA